MVQTTQFHDDPRLHISLVIPATGAPLGIERAELYSRRVSRPGTLFTRSSEFLGEKIGRGLLKDAVLRTLQAAEIAGIRAIFVHAKDDRARGFYERFGFEPSPIHPLQLMLLIKDCREI